MNTKTKIKIIKKGTVRTVETPVITQNTHEPNNASKLTSTVSGWITEFRQRRREEIELATEQFNS